MKKSGIYKIENTTNGMVYIGQTINIFKRIRDHKSVLRNGKHGNSHLQWAYNKIGESFFTFDIILICETEFLDYYEINLIRHYKNIKKCYNFDGGGAKNKIVSEETREKQSIRQIGRKLTEETRRKLSIARKGKKRATPMSAEHRKKISNTLLGNNYQKTGENSPLAKLSNADVEQIIKDTRKNKIIAKEYGVDPSHVSRIKRFQKRNGRGAT